MTTNLFQEERERLATMAFDKYEWHSDVLSCTGWKSNSYGDVLYCNVQFKDDVPGSFVVNFLNKRSMVISAVEFLEIEE